MKTVHYIVHGKVQGVGYRYATNKQAVSLNLKGFVRNCPDKSVEIYAQGDETDLEKFYEWLKIGPSLARVSDVEVQILESKEYFDFSIRS